MLTRRQLSKGLLVGGAAFLSPHELWSSPNPRVSAQPADPGPNAQGQNGPGERDIDLLVKGGTLIDPGQNIHDAMDVAVRDAKISEVSKDIPASRARRVISAKGLLVTPGFIDIHVHCYDGAAGGGTNADHYCLGRGVTAVVDAGTSSYQNIEGFRKYIINSSICRIHALINVDAAGLANFFSRHQDPASVLAGMNVEMAARAVTENRPVTVGIKTLLGATIEGDKDIEALTRARQAAEDSGTPFLAHMDNTSSPLPDLLKLFRKGDIYSHCYNGHPHGILDENGKVIPEAREARERGVLFDPAHGNSHFSFDVAEKCLAQDFLPDTISTDLNDVDIYNMVFDLPTTVSKFLALGMDLDKAIERVTSKPASIFDFQVKIGSLKPGYEADIGIFELRDGNFEFTDSERKTRPGTKMLVNKSVICRGNWLLNQVV